MLERLDEATNERRPARAGRDQEEGTDRRPGYFTYTGRAV